MQKNCTKKKTQVPRLLLHMQALLRYQILVQRLRVRQLMAMQEQTIL